jgi:putative transcriptional regulator
MIRVRINRPTLEIAITRKNLTHKIFAMELGVTPGYLSRVMSGKYEPSPALRNRLLEYLKDYSFDDLFTIEETKQNDRTPNK